MPISRRKPRKYKENKVIKVPKTSRTELTVVERAFAMGAISALRGDYASINDLAKSMCRSNPALYKLQQRIDYKAEALGTQLWDQVNYITETGCGRHALLTQDQKDQIIKLVTSSRDNREKEAWQAIADGDFKEIVPEISVTTFQNVMYEAGYSRHRPSWRPPLTKDQEEERYQWAQDHDPDGEEEYDNKGFDWTTVAFTDETPARIGDERGMIRTWCKEGEQYDDDVKHDRTRNECCLQFYGCFRYNYKGPCHVYYPETEEEKAKAEAHLEELNRDTKIRDNKLQQQARSALNELGESDVNLRRSTRKKQYVPSTMDYKRGDRGRGGIDGYRHREGALQKVVPWIKSLEKKEIKVHLQQDGAPAHKARISRDYLIAEMIDRLWWPGHSPEANASEHAWPWIRRHITKNYTKSCNGKQCEKQWIKA